jgi:hypothetical protein
MGNHRGEIRLNHNRQTVKGAGRHPIQSAGTVKRATIKTRTNFKTCDYSPEKPDVKRFFQGFRARSQASAAGPRSNEIGAEIRA